jgi:hypothetical protein
MKNSMNMYPILFTKTMKLSTKFITYNPIFQHCLIYYQFFINDMNYVVHS